MKTAYIGGIVLDGTKDMAPQKGMTVVVENGRIKELLSSEELIPSDCEIVHLQGSYLMPGLINLHVHLNSSGKPSARKKTPEDYVRLVKLATSNPVTGNLVRSMIRGFAFTELQSGVTTIRTVGGIADYDGKLRNEIEEGCLFREREWKAGSSTLWKGSSPLRAARTGISRIPIGSLAPEGIGAAFRKGTVGHKPFGHHHDERICLVPDRLIAALSCILLELQIRKEPQGMLCDHRCLHGLNGCRSLHQRPHGMVGRSCQLVDGR